MNNKISITEWIDFNSDWIKNKPHSETFGKAFLNKFFPDLSHSVQDEQDHTTAVFTCLNEFVDQSKCIAHSQKKVSQNDADTLARNIRKARFRNINLQS